MFDLPPPEDIAMVDLERSVRFVEIHATKENLRDIKRAIKKLEQLVKDLDGKRTN